MKNHRIIAFVLLLLTCCPLAHEHQSNRCALDNIDLDMQNDNICLREKNRPDSERISIHPDCQVFIDSKKVRLKPRQRTIVRRYYQAARELLTAADLIQRDGKRLETRADELERYFQMKVALAFVDRGTFPLMEAYLENHESEVEDQIDSLRKQAARIREKVDILVETHDALRSSISRLAQLDWF